MRLLYRAAAIARALFRSEAVDDDLADELRFHVDRETEANVRRGMTPDDAYRAARLTVGRIDDALETARDDRPGSALRQIGRDLQFGARLLAKSPAFGATGIAVVALGIGAVTAIFSVVYGVMLRPLPYPEPDRLVSLWTTQPSSEGARLYPTGADARAWRRMNRVFEDVAFVRTTANLNLTGSGEPERLNGARFSPNFLPMLGLAPALGRTFATDEDQPGRDQVVLLSDGLWRRRFAGDPGIVGKTIQLNGLRYLVIGVMPPTFQYPSRDYQAWVPIVMSPQELARQERQNYRVLARLKPNVTPAQAQRDLSAVAQRLAADFPETNRHTGVFVEPMLDSTVGDVRTPLVALLAASAFLLLIACLNLTNLLGARAAARSGEFAVRLALGASRARLVVQAIAETMPLLAVGGVLGVAAATVGVRAFVAMSPPNVPRLESVAVSWPVLLVAFAVLIVTGLAASVSPAIQAWRADFTTMTKDGGRSSTGGRRRRDARRAGVAAQIAFAVPLLVASSLLIRSAIKLAAVDLGFDPEHVASFHLAVSRSKYPSDPQVADYYRRILGAITAIPGVTHAGLVNRLPLAGNQTMSVQIEKAPGSIVSVSSVDSRPITPDYFATMGIALRVGRTFTEHDDPAAPRVAIVDDRLAREMWPGESAVGKRIQLGDAWGTIVGVVEHIHTIGVDQDPRPQVYWSYRQETYDRMALVVRTTAAPSAAIAPVIQTIRALDADQPVYDVRVMTDVVDRSLIQRRLTTMLITAFGVVALVLAAVGVYGVVAFGVTQRLREFGIRVALGATSARVAGLVVREGAVTAVAGAAAGLGAAAALSGAMSNLIFDVAPRDLVSFGAATLVLLGVAVLASYIPARRASAVDPAVTLRAE